MSIWEYNNTLPATVVNQAVVQSEVCIFCNEKLTTLESKNSKLSNRYGHIAGDHDRYVRVCHACGWWTVCEEVTYVGIDAGCYRLCGAAAMLRGLSLPDVNAPIDAIRSYLTAKYDGRFHIHPRV